jgi:hypothetical protein
VELGRNDFLMSVYSFVGQFPDCKAETLGASVCMRD